MLTDYAIHNRTVQFLLVCFSHLYVVYIFKCTCCYQCCVSVFDYLGESLVIPPCTPTYMQGRVHLILCQELPDKNMYLPSNDRMYVHKKIQSISYLGIQFHTGMTLASTYYLLTYKVNFIQFWAALYVKQLYHM